MLRLTHRDLQAAFRFLGTFDVRGGLHAYGISLTAGIPALISSDVTVFASADFHAQTLAAVENPRVTSPADLQNYMEICKGSPNPIIDHYATTGDTEARRMSDFVSRRQFHMMPLYADFYRHLRLEFMLGTCFNDSPIAFDGLTLNRGLRDFTERDRAVLTVLRPHVVQAYRAAAAIDRLRADLALATQAIETPGFGLIVLSREGRMQFVSPGASTLLGRHFDARHQVDELPDLLARWFRHHTEMARDSSRLPPLQSPLVVDRNGTRLVVRLVQVGPDTMLLLEEPDTRSNWLRLTPPGLHPRDARVLLECLREEVVTGGTELLPDVARRVISLFHYARTSHAATPRLTPHEERLLRLLTNGHSYKTAAALLGSSVNTVAFHVKNVYDKLHVHSKAEAVARAFRDGIAQ